MPLRLQTTAVLWVVSRELGHNSVDVVGAYIVTTLRARRDDVRAHHIHPVVAQLAAHHPQVRRRPETQRQSTSPSDDPTHARRARPKYAFVTDRRSCPNSTAI